MCSGHAAASASPGQGGQQNSPQELQRQPLQQDGCNNRLACLLSDLSLHLQIEDGASAPLPGVTGRWRNPGVGDRVVPAVPAAGDAVRACPKQPQALVCRCSTTQRFWSGSLRASWQAFDQPTSFRPAATEGSAPPLFPAPQQQPCRGITGGNRSPFQAQRRRGGRSALGQMLSLAPLRCHEQQAPRARRRQFPARAGFPAP